MHKKLVSFILVCFIIGTTYSNLWCQQCKTSNLRQQHIEQNSNILIEVNRINQFTEHWIANAANYPTSRSVETVPVVVHVLWRTNVQNISDAQILSQIEVLNTDFRKMNSNFPNTPTAFQAFGADVEIEFCLASVDPAGNPTNGITRTQTNVNGIGATNDWYQTANGGHDAWDINQYINIWVCDLGEDGLLGFATPPGTAEPAESDGLTVGYQYFGTIGTAANSNPNHLGRTVTHEMGHYFNLEHLWGPEDGGCNEDDFVADTPNQDRESSECASFPFLDNCTDTGNGLMFMNYMDYSDDGCMTMFSQGQKMRMLAALNGPRAGLLSSNGCANMTGSEDIAFEHSVQIYPNPTNEFLTIRLSEQQTTDNLSFTLLDVLGQEHLKVAIQQTTTIDIAHLPVGVYYLYSNELKKTTQKIIIQ